MHEKTRFTATDGMGRIEEVIFNLAARDERLFCVRKFHPVRRDSIQL